MRIKVASDSGTNSVFNIFKAAKNGVFFKLTWFTPVIMSPLRKKFKSPCSQLNFMPGLQCIIKTYMFMFGCEQELVLSAIKTQLQKF